jgi:hypothetical protein
MPRAWDHFQGFSATSMGSAGGLAGASAAPGAESASGVVSRYLTSGSVIGFLPRLVPQVSARLTGTPDAVSGDSAEPRRLRRSAATSSPRQRSRRVACCRWALSRGSLQVTCGHRLVNTAWMVRVLVIETMPILFQVSPKSARLMSTSASSQISLSPWTHAAVSKNRVRVRPRTVSAPVCQCEVSGHP